MKKVILCPICGNSVEGIIRFSNHLHANHTEEERNKAWLSIIPDLIDTSAVHDYPATETRGDDNIDWDKDAKRASQAHWPYTSYHSLLYLDDVVPQRFIMLDLGCQIGSWYTGWKELRPNCEYHGVDFSHFAIAIARDRYPDATFYHKDVTRLNFIEMFDVIFTHAVLQHMNQRSHLLLIPRIHAALRPYGLLIIEENIESAFSTDYWIKLFSNKGFKLIKTSPQTGGMAFVFRKV